MNYLNKENQTTLFLYQIEYYRKSIANLKEVKKAILLFDGKVFNKRLQDALPENYRITKDGIEYCDYNNRTVKAIGKDCGYNYINVYTIYMGKYSGIEENRSYLDDNNRIVADILIRQLDMSYTRIVKTIETAEAEYKKVNELIERKEKILAEIENHNGEISFITRDYFNLDINIKR